MDAANKNMRGPVIRIADVIRVAFKTEKFRPLTKILGKKSFSKKLFFWSSVLKEKMVFF